jgi:hypothetical protein
MSRNTVIAFVVGAVCVIVAVTGIVYMQRGAHLELPGGILKARTAALDENSSVAMLDFRLTNTSDYPAVVRTVLVYAEEKNGNRLEGQTISDPDAQRVFDGIKLLGTKYLQSLVTRDRLPARATWDRMIGARFEVPDGRLQSRKRFVISIEEIDGRFFEIAEK